MPIEGIAQPEILAVSSDIRLRRYDGCHSFALAWYEDPETVYLVDGVRTPYTKERLAVMYAYLDRAGELYWIEAKVGDTWQPIGDVTMWQEDLPIVIGDRNFRGRGIGLAVVKRLMQRARELGFPSISVQEIYHYNTASRRMFEKAGFVKTGETEKGISLKKTLEDSMNHTGTVTLETQDLILRRFCADDAQDMYNNYASDPEVTKFLTWPVHASPDASRQLLLAWEKEYADPSVYNWAIVEKACGQVIGGISIVRANEAAGMLHVGYCIGRAFWHRGYMTQALTAVRDHLFEKVGILRLEARHDPDNPNSGKVMKKCGMVYEGTLRRSDVNNRGIVDEAYYGLLREEWEEIRQK